MKNIILFIITTVLIYGCSSSNKTDDQKEANKENKDSMLEVKSNYDSLILKTEMLLENLKGIGYLAKLWTNQARSDSQEKMEFLQCEASLKKFRALDRSPFSAEIDNEIKLIHVDLDSLLLLTDSLKTELNSFESYENVESVFMMQVMTESDGDFAMLCKKIAQQAESLLKLVELEAKKIE